MKNVYDNIVQLIANKDNPTPLVRLEKIFPDKNVYLKLEWFNPFGSLKDRIAYGLLKDASDCKNKQVIEASSGNTAIALAGISNYMGLPVQIAIPNKAPEEKKIMLKLLGVQLWEADDNLCPLFPTEGARGLARSLYLSKDNKEKSIYTNQYENEKNVETHYNSTGPEIWEQTDKKISHFFTGFGTTGTISGVGKFLKEQNTNIKIIGIEPEDTEHNLPGLKNISKLADEYIPKILKKEYIDEIIGVGDDESYINAIELAKKEGILAGPTTGSIIAGFKKYSKNTALTDENIIVLISADSAFKYANNFKKYLKDKDWSYTI